MIVFTYPLDPSKDFIKRVVAVTGDTVEVRNKKLYLNGKPVQDKFRARENPTIYPVMVQPRDNYGPVTVPQNAVFVMGDNRDHSYDSRFWGFLDLDKVRGQAFIIYWSWDANNWRPLWDRIGDRVR